MRQLSPENSQAGRRDAAFACCLRLFGGFGVGAVFLDRGKPAGMDQWRDDFKKKIY